LFPSFLLSFLLFTSNVFANFIDGYEAYKENDYVNAFNAWDKSSREGDFKSLIWLAHLYEDGLGVAQNKDKAISLYRSIANIMSSSSSDSSRPICEYTSDNYLESLKFFSTMGSGYSTEEVEVFGSLAKATASSNSFIIFYSIKYNSIKDVYNKSEGLNIFLKRQLQEVVNSSIVNEENSSAPILDGEQTLKTILALYRSDLERKTIFL
jgi:hypothetical protein